MAKTLNRHSRRRGADGSRSDWSRLANHDPELEIVAALDAPSHPRLGDDAGVLAGVGPIHVPLTAALATTPDVVIDFSVPAGAAVRS